METIVNLILSIIGIYLLIGVIAYFPLLRKGIPSFDDSMHETPLLFKILIFPGVVALWLPLFLKWRKIK
jgi:putative effector of murein hydrolase